MAEARQEQTQETGLVAARSPLAVKVRAIDVATEPAELLLTSGEATIGAGRDVDLLIGHPTVSRNHLRLTLVPEGVRVEDLGSRNGSFYLGQRIERVTLAPGSRLRLGDVDVDLVPVSEALSQHEPSVDDRYHELIGPSLRMRQLFTLLQRLERSLVNVLIEGDSGVGKELVARAIHARSQVSEGPLVSLNCGAMQQELIASQLFGHRRGSFTGAVEDRPGAFEAAHGGTLFLDEVGDLPTHVQPTLLRALETGEVMRVGEQQVRQVKVRLIAATNRKLDEDVETGRFRQDLFYRLVVVRVEIPPLRERRADIPHLVAQFAARANATVPDDVVRQWVGQPWLGNVRELRNAVESFLAIGTLPAGMTQEGASLDEALAELCRFDVPYQQLKSSLVERFTALYLDRLMKEAEGNQTVAAKIAGTERSYLRRMLTRHGMLDSE